MPKTANTPQTPRLLTLKATAEYLGLKVWSLRTRIWAGEIPIVRFRGGRKIFIDRQDLEEFIRKNKETYVWTAKRWLNCSRNDRLLNKSGNQWFIINGETFCPPSPPTHLKYESAPVKFCIRVSYAQRTLWISAFHTTPNEDPSCLSLTPKGEWWKIVRTEHYESKESTLKLTGRRGQFDADPV